MLALIAAYAENHVIGQNGRIPWDIPEEKHRFRDLTMGHVIIMGRRTYEEIGRPLPGRETIVVSRTKCFDAPHCTTVSSFAAALQAAGERDAFICGGAQLYREALPLADVLYLTEIHREFAGDVQFPTFDAAAFERIEWTDIPGEIPYTFVTYRRRVMDYTQARDYIAALTAEKGIVPGLGPVRELLARLGNPQDACPVVHIAGTNGKGSTLAMTASMLQAAGYRVGTYSSPAVFSPRECWQVNGEMITEEAYASWMTKLCAVRDAMHAEGLAVPTAFEMETALAFCWLAQQQCDIAVIECGMGGRGDATNVTTATAVSVLVSIGMDHMKFLGSTIEEIAQAKGGIIKPGIPVVLQGQDAAIERKIRELCAQQGSPLTIIRPEELSVTQANAKGVTFDYQKLQQVEAALPGLVQARNAVTAIAAVQQLKDFDLSEQAIREGLRHVRWKGRLEQLCDRPVILMDGAHNPNAAARLREEMLYRFPDKKLIEIVGVLADKDFTEVGRLMAPLAQRIFTITPDSPRALAAEQLADCLRQFCDDVTPVDSTAQALDLALDAAGETGVILAFGSLSWLHTLRDAVEERI
ncbi:MAG: dihydrofolate reductase [Eubacteriales bacterium]|nr:dihydrofolate reductase [Eubacteriales bacterium]